MTDQTREKLLEKIQKLLSLGQGTPYEEEAKTALNLAQKLMIDNAIEMAEVTSHEMASTDWTTETAWQGTMMTRELNDVAIIVNTYFFVKVIYSGRRGNRRIQIFGDRENVSVAKHVLVYLSRVFRDLWATHQSQYEPGTRASNMRMYYRGLRDGFCLKLEAERRSLSGTSKTALVRLDHALTEALKDVFPNLTKPEPRAPLTGDIEAYQDGKIHGRAISLRTTIEKATNHAGQLTGGR